MVNANVHKILKKIIMGFVKNVINIKIIVYLNALMDQFLMKIWCNVIKKNLSWFNTLVFMDYWEL